MTQRVILADVIGNDLRLLICGLNPGKRSSEEGRYFADETNRFWDILRDTELTPHVLSGVSDTELKEKYRIGITDLSKHTIDGDVVDVTKSDRERLTNQVLRIKPTALAFLGKRPAASFLELPRKRIAWGLSNRRIGPTRSGLSPTPLD